MTLGVKDQRVIKAFCRQEAQDGYKLDTDGHILNGAWMGGSKLAYWSNGRIVYPETGSRTGDGIQRAIERCHLTGRCTRAARR